MDKRMADRPENMTTYVFICSLVASFGGLIFGYDIGISGENMIIQLINTMIMFKIGFLLSLSDQAACMDMVFNGVYRWGGINGLFPRRVLPIGLPQAFAK